MKYPKSVVLYYSEGSMPFKFQEACFKRLIAVIPPEMGLLCIVPQKLKQMVEKYPHIIKECDNRGFEDLINRIEIGCRHLPGNTPIAMAEHDVIYGPGHFQPFIPKNKFNWPILQGLKLEIDDTYRRLNKPLLSLRSSKEALLDYIKNDNPILCFHEPKGHKDPDYIANYIDIRWNGNYSKSPMFHKLILDPPNAPPALKLRQWVNNLINGGEDDESIQLLRQ